MGVRITIYIHTVHSRLRYMYALYLMVFIVILVCVERENFYFTIENSINSLIRAFPLSEQNILLGSDN